MNANPLNTLEFISAICLFVAYLFSYYAIGKLLIRPQTGWVFRLVVWSIGTNLLATIFYLLTSKELVWAMYTSGAIVMVVGYTLIHYAFLFVSARYRQNPRSLLDAIKQVTLPRGGERVYYAIEQFRQGALKIDPKISSNTQMLIGMTLVLPYASLLFVPPENAAMLFIMGVVAGVAISTLGYITDLTAALIRMGRSSQR